jgi:hypothetical protein
MIGKRFLAALGMTPLLYQKSAAAAYFNLCAMPLRRRAHSRIVVMVRVIPSAARNL